MQSVEQAWAAFSDITIKKCAAKCGFQLTNNSKEAVERAESENNNLENLMQLVDKRYNKFVSDLEIFTNNNLACYKDHDSLVKTIVADYTSDEATDDLDGDESGTSIESGESGKSGDGDPKTVTMSKAVAAANLLAQFCKQKGMSSEALKLYKLLRKMHKEQLNNLKQLNLKEFFSVK